MVAMPSVMISGLTRKIPTPMPLTSPIAEADEQRDARARPPCRAMPARP